MKSSKLAVALGVLILAASGTLSVLVMLRQSRTVTATFYLPYPQSNVKGDPIPAVMKVASPAQRPDVKN